MMRPVTILLLLCGARALAEQPSPLKDIALDQAGDFRLSLGGTLRERYEVYRNPAFGLRGLSRTDYLLQRILLDADLRSGDHFRAMVQLGSHLESGKPTPGPTDQNEFDFQQAFIDLAWTAGEDGRFLLRSGRQEMTFGSGRLVAVRDGANVRRSFDGIRLGYSSGDLKVDVFAAQAVELRSGAFDDRTDDGETLWGIYSVMPAAWLPDGHVDFYYLGLDRHDAVFSSGTGRERRHSLGTRLWGNPGAWYYNYEAVVQWGTFASADILAWTLATDTGYTFTSIPWSPRIGLKVNLASGDEDSRDGRLATFNALFPNLSYFSDASLVAPSNIIDLHPTLEFHPKENITLTMDVNFFWKHRTGDAIYAPPGRPLVPADPGGSRFIGWQMNAGIEWQVNPSLTCSLHYSHFFTGDAVKAAGGRDVDFLGAWVVARF